MRRLLMAWALACAGGAAWATGVQMKHTVTLKAGWNAFYLPVTPAGTADEVFADWPVERVGFYDQTAFGETRQFTTGADDSTQGAIVPGMKMWVRGDPGHSSFDALAANGVYVAVNTNKTAFTADLYGEPAAYRVAWHVSDGVTRPLNYVGVSCVSNAQLTADGYLQGLETGWSGRWAVYGVGTAAAPGLQDIARRPTAEHGGVIAMDAEKVSDWSGTLNVSPVSGISLGTNLSVAAVSIRNDAATNRLVRVAFREGAWADGSLHLPVPTVMYLDPAIHAAWQPSLRAEPYVRELRAGETLRLKLAVDRERELLSPEAGTEYGGVIDVTDVSTDRPSGFQTSIPFSAASDGGEFRRTQWPKGLWVATVTLDKVGRMVLDSEVEEYETEVAETTYETTRYEEHADGTVTTNVVTETAIVTNWTPILATAPIPVASPMKLRLMVHVDAAGAMNLMQRARHGGRRLTVAVLPTDTPVLPGSGTFGSSAQFGWTVAETSKVNPFRHAKHPDHDGLNATFDGPAPSGDNFDNYLETVKPELFSIVNKLDLTWDATRAAAWSPEETLTGTCAWSIQGLRREGAVRMSGTFSMRRVSTADLADLREDR